MQGEVSAEEVVTSMTNWDLSIKELQMVHSGDVDSASRLAKTTKFERAIAELREKVISMYEAESRASISALHDSSTRPERLRAEDRGRFYRQQANDQDLVQPVHVDSTFDSIAEIRTARMIPLHQRDAAVRQTFWQDKVNSLEVCASFLSHVITVVDVK